MDIQRDLLVPRCARAGCHVPEDPASGVDYLSGGLEERLVGRPSFGCADRFLIDPSEPAESYLLERLSASPQCDGMAVPAMPLDGRDPLNDHELHCLTLWVQSLAGGPAPTARDAGPLDGGESPQRDAGPPAASDGGPPARPDGGPPARPDSGPPDVPDAGPPAPPDAGPPDAGPPDAGPPDAGPPDAGPPDAGPPDAGPEPLDGGP